MALFCRFFEGGGRTYLVDPLHFGCLVKCMCYSLLCDRSSQERPEDLVTRAAVPMAWPWYLGKMTGA